jgi:hypothetical protein
MAETATTYFNTRINVFSSSEDVHADTISIYLIVL